MLNLLCALIPYLAMVVGLHVFHSAWLAFAIYHGLILAVMLNKADRVHWQDLLRGWDWKLGGGAIVFGLGGGVLMYLLAPMAGIGKSMIEPALAKLGLNGVSWLIFVFYHSLVNPWFEEVLWRGKLGSPNLKPVLNDFLFAGYHALVLVLFLEWIWIALAFVVLTVAGWLWRQLKRERKGLLVPVISHLSADASIMFVVYILGR